MDAEVGGEVPDAQRATADAEQALPLGAQLLHRAAVPLECAYALALLQIPYLRKWTRSQGVSSHSMI